MKLLIIGRGYRGVTGDQIEGFDMYKHELRDQLQLDVSRVELFSLREIEQEVKTTSADVVLAMTSFTEDPAQLAAMYQRLYERPRRPKLVYLDYFAQTASPYFGILPFVDRYVKRQVLKHRAEYQTELRGGYIFADWFSRKYDYDLGGWNFGSTLDPRYADRLVKGWSLGVRTEYRRTVAAQRFIGKKLRSRKYDINARLGLQKRPEREWYEVYREHSQRAVEALRGRFALTPTERVSYWRYLRELNDSKIIFSPFGWGELCYRDYEAVSWGALLMKPSMAHVDVSPNIFIEGETYVPLEWDSTDLADKVAYWLTATEKAETIAVAARKKLHEYFEKGGFVADVKRTLADL